MSENKEVKLKVMVMRRLYKDGHKTLYNLSSNEGYIKAKLPAKPHVSIGDIIEITGKKDKIMDVTNVEILEGHKSEDYLPMSKKPINEIMDEIEEMTNECILSAEGKKLNDYFFKDEKFIEKFKRGIGGVSMHHNYIGGLAEHTLNVMYLTKVLCDRYDCRRREVAVLSAKLHDIGKIYELDSTNRFTYTLEGELEGHIVIGVQMIDRAILDMKYPFSEDFIRRVKGCIVQHHGKIEYGSPRAANMEESYIINLADSADATMNKIAQIKEHTHEDTWSEYDKKLETKLYL